MTVESGARDCVESEFSLVAAGERALHVDGDLQAARSWFDAAYQQAESTGDVDAMAAAALGFGGVWVHEHRVGAAAAVLEQRLRRLQGITEASRRALEDMHPTQSDKALCTRERQHWRVEWDGRSMLVENSVGMLHLAVLIANAGTEIPAVELAMGVSGLAQAAGARTSAQPVLDQEAMRRYRQRVAELRKEIESATSDQRTAEAKAESEVLLAELAGNVGIGGRSRRFIDNAERARVAVGKAIRRAITRVEEADPAIGRHLRETVHTGRLCSYRP